jgi:type IX secretion system PorP/SprF family membrane protein
MKIFFGHIKSGIRMKFFFILNFLFLIFHYVSAQQDPQYSQYMFNQLVINPAYAGCKDAINATLMLRNQWVGVDGAPKTQTFSVHTPLSKKKIGIGLHVMSDQIGPRKNTGVFGSYSYKINLPKGKLSMGLRFGVFQYVYNWGSIDHLDQADNVYTQNRSNYIVPSADFGLYYYNNDMYAGASVTHLFNGRITSVAVNGDNAAFVPHVFVTAGKAFDVSSSILINPSVVIRTAQYAPVNFDINFNALFQQRVWGGISYRSSHGVVLLTQIIVTDRFRVGYSFDWGFNELDKLSTGTHEIMLGYDFALLRKSRMVSPRYF